MADLLGTNRPSPSEERTVEESTADADAFAGLPVGGSLDDAARAMRVTPSPAAAPTVPSAGAVASASSVAAPDAGGEDPLTLALRIAHQAQEAAAAAEAATKPVTNGNGSYADPAHSNGNGAAANGGAAGSEVGVVPEEPENEDTVRAGANATQSTVDSPGTERTVPEPTVPSESEMIAPDTSDSGPVIGEETPALTEEQRASLLEEGEPDTVVDEPPPARGAVPDAPTSEATPSAPRPPPLAQMPEEPREEPTIRKSSPPPALTPPTRLAPRTGTGPSGIGALGFRISSNRPVVRPAFNGRPSSPGHSTPAGGTPALGSAAIERPSERVSIERPLAPDRPSRTNLPAAGRAIGATPPSMPAASNMPIEPPPAILGRATSDDARAAVPVWLLGIGVGLVATVIVAGLAWIFLGGAGNSETPVATPTAFVEATEIAPTATPEVGLPAATATLAVSPTRSATPISTVTPRPTATRATPTPTALVIATVKPSTPAPTPAATPAPTSRGLSAKERVDEIVRKKPNLAAARLEIYTQAKNHSDVDFVYEAFRFLAKSPEGTKPEDEKIARRLAKEVAENFLAKQKGDPRAGLVRNWITTYEKEAP